VDVTEIVDDRLSEDVVEGDKVIEGVPVKLILGVSDQVGTFKY